MTLYRKSDREIQTFQIAKVEFYMTKNLMVYNFCGQNELKTF